MSLVSYPIEINNQNRIQLTEDPGAELDLLLRYDPNFRTFEKDYGLSVANLQQAATDPRVYIPIFSLEMREKLRKYTRNVELVEARIYKNINKRRTIYLEIVYKLRNTEVNKTFEINVT
jgi:hypothetical protein